MFSPNSPCAACKLLRRKCTQECVFAPYFPPDQPQKFAIVHKVFGASNVAKILNELNINQRQDAVNSLAYEADARLRDPVYGCVGLISVLQQKLKQVQNDLRDAKIELANYIGPSAMLPGFAYNMQPVMGLAGPGNFLDPQDNSEILETLRVDQQQQRQPQMLRSYVHQQHQQQPVQQQQPVDIVRLVTDGGFNPVTVPATMFSVGSTYVNSMYQIQQKPEPLKEPKPQLQPHQLLLRQEARQPPPLVQRIACEDDRRVAPSC